MIPTLPATGMAIAACGPKVVKRGVAPSKTRVAPRSNSGPHAAEEDLPLVGLPLAVPVAEPPVAFADVESCANAAVCSRTSRQTSHCLFFM